MTSATYSLFKKYLRTCTPDSFLGKGTPILKRRAYSLEILKRAFKLPRPCFVGVACTFLSGVNS